MPFTLLHLCRVLLDSIFSHAAIAVVGLEQIFSFVRPYPLQAYLHLVEVVHRCIHCRKSTDCVKDTVEHMLCQLYALYVFYSACHFLRFGLLFAFGLLFCRFGLLLTLATVST